MSENVVSLHGTYVPTAPETSKVVIEELERLLDAAKSGEIIPLARTYSEEIVASLSATQRAGLESSLERMMQRIDAQRQRS